MRFVPFLSNWVIMLGFAFFTNEGTSQSSADRPPNIVFILTDDLGYGDLGCYGNPYNETPYIDSLASRGLRFTQAYAASPICSPSRAAIMSGLHPARLHLTNFLVGNRQDSTSGIAPPDWTPYLESSVYTLPEMLGKNGYRSSMIGKWHLGWSKGQTPWDQGFEESKMICGNGLDYYDYSICDHSYDQKWTDDGTHYLTDRLSEYATDFISRQNEGTPFFLFLSYSAPHVFIVPRGDKLQKYMWKYGHFNGKYNPYYAAMVESIDDGVGAIIKALKQKGLYDNTIIVFTSDNGGLGMPELGPTPTTLEPLRYWKGHNYEGGTRIPMIVHWPGVTGTGEVETPISNIDYFSTFAEIVGETSYQPTDSKSFLEELQSGRNASNSDDKPIFWHYPHFSNQMGRPSSAVRKGDWKLIHFYEDGRNELYNLINDIGEENDLSKSQRKKVKELSSLLENWKTSVGAQEPVSIK